MQKVGHSSSQTIQLHANFMDLPELHSALDRQVLMLGFVKSVALVEGKQRLQEASHMSAAPRQIREQMCKFAP